MRKYMTAAACAAALSLSACTESSETYAVPVTDAWSKLASAGMGAESFAVPSGLLGADVRARFETIPTDSTGYWKFTRNGKELGRVNVAVEGDQESSTISYSYTAGEISEEDEKAERMIRQYSQPLIVEAVDARFEDRERDSLMKSQADAHTAMAMSGQMMKDVHASMEEHIKKSKEREAASANAGSRYDATRPATDLSKFN